MMEVNPALAPLVELGSYVLSHKNDVPASTDELVFVGVGPGSNKRKDRDAIWRGNRYPAITGFITNVNEQIEPKLVQVESQASILIADQDRNVVQAKMKLSIRAITGLIQPM